MVEKSQDVLEVVETCSEFRIQWWIPENEDYGAIVGEGVKDGREPVREKDTDLEWYTAEMAVFKLYQAQPNSEVFGLDNQGFWWSSKSAAIKALAKIKEEIRAALRVSDSRLGWPEWAITAKDNGWKPPKGWKP